MANFRFLVVYCTQLQATFKGEGVNGISCCPAGSQVLTSTSEGANCQCERCSVNNRTSRMCSTICRSPSNSSFILSLEVNWPVFKYMLAIFLFFTISKEKGQKMIDASRVFTLLNRPNNQTIFTAIEGLSESKLTLRFSALSYFPMTDIIPQNNNVSSITLERNCNTACLNR